MPTRISNNGQGPGQGLTSLQNSTKMHMTVELLLECLCLRIPEYQNVNRLKRICYATFTDCKKTT